VTVQAHVKAVLDLLDADNTAPALVVMDGYVTTGTVAPYVLVYFTVASPDGEVAPDKISLTLASTAIDVRAYCHCVGGNGAAARAVATRVRTALLDVTPTVVGRACFPIRWKEGQPPVRDESTGTPVFDLVDVYGFTSVPG
jgi:hypothetical protein